MREARCRCNSGQYCRLHRTYSSGRKGVGKVGELDDRTNLLDGSEYTDEELAFLRAVDEFRIRTHKKFPTLCDLLGILKTLGYKAETT